MGPLWRASWRWCCTRGGQPAAARSATIPHKLGAHKGPTLYPSFVLLLDATLPAHTRAADSPAGRSEALELLRGTGAQPTTKQRIAHAEHASPRSPASPRRTFAATCLLRHRRLAHVPQQDARIVSYIPRQTTLIDSAFMGMGSTCGRVSGSFLTPLYPTGAGTHESRLFTTHSTPPLFPVLFLKVLAGDRLAGPVVSCLLPSSQACDALERRHLPSLSFVGHRLDERMANKWDQSEKENGPAVRRACTTPHKPEHPPAHPAEARRVLLLEQHPT